MNIDFFTDDISARTGMILLNAVYFKGNWANRFNESLTKNREFNVNKELKKSVPTMFIKGRFEYQELPEYGVKFIKLPYQV